MQNKLNILLIGCGQMGQAMLKGWLQAGIINHAHVVDPFSKLEANASITLHQTAPTHLDNIDMVVLAIKPQMLAETLAYYTWLPSGVPVLSILAGQSMAAIAAHLSPAQPIIRAMPNLPATIGQGISGAVCNAHVTATQQAMAQSLLAAMGQVAWLDDEELLHAVTALSGSGPAYMFLVLETMQHAGVALGLDADLALRLAVQTMAGAAALQKHTGESPSILRQNVTSPQGTTAAALDVLYGQQWPEILQQALNAAHDRSVELGAQ